MAGQHTGGRFALGLAAAAFIATVGLSPAPLAATPGSDGGQAPAPAAPEVTYTKHIAPILQRSCEGCHRKDGVAPMSLSTYEEVRPWARSIKQRTGIGPHAGVMPPWYVERDLGIQKFKNDPSLSEAEIAAIARWVDSGAPRGDAADMPAARVWNDRTKWAIGEPDLVVRTEEVTVKAGVPDWWGEIQPDAYRAHRGPLRVGGRSARGQRRQLVGHRPRDRRRPLRVPPHDLEHPAAGRTAGHRPCRSLRPRRPHRRQPWAPPPGRCTKWAANRTSSIRSQRAC